MRVVSCSSCRITLEMSGCTWGSPSRGLAGGLTGWTKASFQGSIDEVVRKLSSAPQSYRSTWMTAYPQRSAQASPPRARGWAVFTVSGSVAASLNCPGPRLLLWLRPLRPVVGYSTTMTCGRMSVFRNGSQAKRLALPAPGRLDWLADVPTSSSIITQATTIS